MERLDDKMSQPIKHFCYMIETFSLINEPPCRNNDLTVIPTKGPSGQNNGLMVIPTKGPSGHKKPKGKKKIALSYIHT